MTLTNNELRDLLERAAKIAVLLRIIARNTDHHGQALTIDIGADIITRLATENPALRAENARLTAAKLTLAADGLLRGWLLDEAREVVRFYAEQSHPMNNGEKARAFMEKTNG